MGSMCSGPVPPQPFPLSSRRPWAVRGRGLRYVTQALSPEMMNAEVKAEKQERKWSPPPATLHLLIGERGEQTGRGSGRIKPQTGVVSA